MNSFRRLRPVVSRTTTALAGTTVLVSYSLRPSQTQARCEARQVHATAMGKKKVIATSAAESLITGGNNAASKVGGAAGGLLDKHIDRLQTFVEGQLNPAMKDVLTTLQKLMEDLGKDFGSTNEERGRLLLNLLMLKVGHDKAEAEDNKSMQQKRARALKNLNKVDRQAVQDGAHYSKFAVAAYGTMGNLSDLKNRIVNEGGMEAMKEIKAPSNLESWYISHHCGIKAEDVVRVQGDASIEARSYFLAVDHSTKSVVLAIRGTFSLTDTLMDLLMECKEYMGGQAHEGVLQASEQLWGATKEDVKEQLQKNEGYQLVLTGHSLGAGVASLLALRLAAKGGMEDEGLPRVPVRCFAFAPPPTFGPVRKIPRDVEDSIIAYVNRNDIVARMSLTSIYKLLWSLRRIDRLPLSPQQRLRYLLDQHFGEVGSHNPHDEQERKAVLSDMKDLGKQLESAWGDFARGVKSGDGDGDQQGPRSASDLWKAAKGAKNSFERIVQGVDKVMSNANSSHVMEAALDATIGGDLSIEQMEEIVHSAIKERAPDPKEGVPEMEGSEVAKRAVAEFKKAPGGLQVPGRIYWMNHISSDQDEVEDSAENNAYRSVERVEPGRFNELDLSDKALTDHSVEKYEEQLTELSNALHKNK